MMKRLFMLIGLAFIIFPAFAYDNYVESMDGYEYDPKQHYSVNNRIIPINENWPAPCNYANVSAQSDCYYTENEAIKLFFKGVPAKLNRRDPSGKQARKFKAEQKRFERRVARYCERQDELYYSQAQGSGNGMLNRGCIYYKYHPRFLKRKRMLGEPHPVRPRAKQAGK